MNTREIQFPDEPPPLHIIDWWNDDTPDKDPTRIGGNDLDMLLTQFHAVTEPVKRAQAFVSSKDGTYVLVTVNRSDAKKGQRDPKLFDVLDERARAIPEHTLAELEIMCNDNPTFWRD